MWSTGSGRVVGAVEAGRFDDTLGNFAHVEGDAARIGLVNEDAAEFFRDTFGSEAGGAIGANEVELESRDVLLVQSERSREVLLVRHTNGGVVSVASTMEMRAVPSVRK